MTLNIFTDGGSINNPGPSACSFLIYQDKKLLSKGNKFLGANTNNFAEYSAIILAIEEIKKLLENQQNKNIIKKLIFHSDSNLMINQLNGLFKVKNSIIRELILKIRNLEGEINLPTIYKYIPREKNQEADGLVKEVLQKF